MMAFKITILGAEIHLRLIFFWYDEKLRSPLH